MHDKAAPGLQRLVPNMSASLIRLTLIIVRKLERAIEMRQAGLHYVIPEVYLIDQFNN